MAAGFVSGPATALALKQAGLEHLLLDEAQARAIRAAFAAERPPAASASAPVAEARASRPGPRAPRKEARPANAPGAGTAETEAPQPVVWPSAWRERLTKTRAAPVLWTYWELGLDMCGTPDPQRRELVQELLRDLAHPPGTHSFWPLSLPAGNSGNEQPEANAPVFWEGVRLLRGRAVIVMGSQALRALALPDPLPAMRPFQQRRHQGRLLIVLPSPDMLAQDARRAQLPRLREFLRQALAPFA